MDSDAVDLEEGSSSGADPTPPPPQGEPQREAPVQARKRSSVGVPPGRAPFAIELEASTGRRRARWVAAGCCYRWPEAGRTPVASSSDDDGPVQKKGKASDGDKQAQKAKSPVGTSCSSKAPSESVNEISVDDDEVVEVNAAARATRKLTSKVCLEMTKELVRGEWKAICKYCNKHLSAASKSGTSHLLDHLKICTLRQLKLKSNTGKSLSQSSLRMTAQSDGKVNVESYTFDQDTAREELGNMIVLHDYPLSIVDHAGFRRFVAALQPLFQLHTRNTIRKDIIGRHDKEKIKAIGYMIMLQSRVAVTTDMWTADSQKKGYMAITGHFVDDSWKLRSILMGFIYVPARLIIAHQMTRHLRIWWVR